MLKGKRCPTCLAPMKREYVFHRKIGTDNKPQIYHYVQKISCPDGCATRLDFSKAKPLRPGMTPMVVGHVEPVRGESDFNEMLLTIGLSFSAVIFLVGLLLIPGPVYAKAIIAVLLAAATIGVFSYANHRVVLPESFPLPMRQPKVEEVEEVETKAVPVTATAAPATKTKKVEVEIPDVIPPMPRVEGEPIKMYVILEGEQHELEVNEGENMLDAAIEREVEIDYSCLEGMCDSCLVRILGGVENITPPTQEEYDMLGEEEVNRGFRLACQVKVNGPVKLMQE